MPDDPRSSDADTPAEPEPPHLRSSQDEPAEGQEEPPAPASGDTSVLPAAGDDTLTLSGGTDATGHLPTEPAAWSGRAQVPAGHAGAGPSTEEWAGYGDEWAEPRQRPARAWWMPALLTLAALGLLAVLGIGVWLIGQGLSDTGPVVPPPATSSTPSESPTPREQPEPPPPEPPPPPPPASPSPAVPSPEPPPPPPPEPPAPPPPPPEPPSESSPVPDV